VGTSEPDHAVERRGRTEARLNRLEDQMLGVHQEMHSFVKGALSSFNNDLKQNSEHFLAEIERLDNLVRGPRGDNGLTSEVRKLTDAFEVSRRRQAVFEGAFIATIVGAVVGLIFKLFLQGTP